MKKEFVIGLVAIIAGTVLYLGLNFLKGADILGRSTEYYMFFDRVDGLEKSNPVVYKGYTVGLVTQIKINQDGQLKVWIELNKPITITDSSYALLKGSGLLGNQKIELILNKGGKELVSGDELRSKIALGGFNEIKTQAGLIGSHVDSTIVEIKTLANFLNQSTGKIDTALTNFKDISTQTKHLVVENRQRLGRTMKNVELITASLVNLHQQITPILDTLSVIANNLNDAKLKETVEQAHQTMGQVNLMITNLNQGNGTLGKLMVNDSLYNNLNSAVSSLDSLLLDLRARPKRYVHFSVFGRKAQ